MSLQHLFDAELRYRPDMAPVVVDGEGELIGSGDGTVRGPNVRGTMRWTLFERPGELVCAMNPAVVIETDDGASIRVEGRGYARRGSREDRRWHVAATLRFDAADGRYAWLDGALGVWEGEFDADTRRARYRAYASLDGAASFTRVDEWRGRRGQLSAGERSLYREILLAFARGETPSRTVLAPRARSLAVDLDAALARFEQLDLVCLDRQSGEIVVAYPFSGHPTAHRLTLADGNEAFAMCAVDALGVAAMLGQSVRIESRDPITGERISVDVSPAGDARWSPDGVVVFAGGREGSASVSELCCPVVNFFASPETAESYLNRQSGLSGRLVSVQEALERGRAIFGAALTGDSGQSGSYSNA